MNSFQINPVLLTSKCSIRMMTVWVSPSKLKMYIHLVHQLVVWKNSLKDMTLKTISELIRKIYQMKMKILFKKNLLQIHLSEFQIQSQLQTVQTKDLLLITIFISQSILPMCSILSLCSKSFQGSRRLQIHSTVSHLKI